MLLKSNVARIVPHCSSSVVKEFSNDRIKLFLEIFKLVTVNAVCNIAGDMTVILLFDRSRSFMYFAHISVCGGKSVKLFELKSTRPKVPIRYELPKFSKLFC